MNDLAFHDALGDWLLADVAARSAQDGCAAQAGLSGIDPVRLSVHRNTFVVTLVDALVESYPACVALLGAECFRGVAREYVLAEPPRSPVVSEYVLGFPGFVARPGPLAAMPFVADVALLEAARIRAFHAADAEPLDAAAFAPLAADPARLATTRVVLHPAARWWRATTPALDLWAAHQVDAADCVDPSAIDLSAIDVARTQDVLVSRPAYVVDVAALPPGAIAFLDALRDGAAIADAFAAASGEGDADAATLFGLLLARGLATALVEVPG